MDALEASLVRLAAEAAGEEVCARPVALPAGAREIQVWAAMSRRWVDQQFYVVDRDLDEARAENRHPVKFRRFEGRRLSLAVPKGTCAALRDAGEVRVFCVSDVEIRLKQALLRALREASRGGLVAGLWSAQRPLLDTGGMNGLTDRPLNVAQREALAAMTSRGAFFVWGPPGTGKTTVITAAVRDALEHDRTVLVASHTHVAVDNVLEGLFDPSGGTGRRAAAGVVVRVASSETQEKVSLAVREHEYLLLDKAVAKLTGQVERQADLDHRREENRSHEDRRRLGVTIEDLSDVDVQEIELARSAADAWEQIAQLQPAVAALEDQLADLEERVQAHRTAAAALNVADEELHRAQSELERARQELAGDEQATAQAVGAVRSCQRECAILSDRLREARGAIQRGLGRVPAIRRRRARDAEQLAIQAGQAEATLREAKESHRSWTEVLGASQFALADAEQTMQAIRGRTERALRESNTADELEGRCDALRGACEPQATRLAGLRELAAAVPETQAQQLVTDAQRSGVLAKLALRDSLNERVARLDGKLQEIDREQARLDDDVAGERARLLAQAPVIACTLAALSMDRALLKRRFDVVILDEVASIEAPYVAFAGSRSDRTLALVGDFLQNAPIADADDVVGEGDRDRADWQKRDIFFLAGIHDRASAEGHPRCVALRTQYRYPLVIAQVVNAFCYDGLLESHQPAGSPGGPVITLIDTSRHPGKQLQPDRGSWYYQLGLDLLTAIAQQAAERTGDLGFVCPYRTQAYRAGGLSTREGLGVQCGTAHRFQGREFHTVIVDLMQDSRPRWTGVADLAGSERQVSAAKLLNVALTRAKNRLYLIGDWDFIQRYDSPGMQAIAALDGHPAFQILDAVDITPA